MATVTKRQYKADPELVSILKNPPKRRCTVGQLIEDHPNGKEIGDAVNNPRWSSAALAKVLASKAGFPISGDAVSKHANNTCVCER